MKGKQYLYIIGLIVLLFAVPSFAAQVKLAWDASSGEVKGYRIYYGTTKGSHPTQVEVGDATSHEVTGLEEGVTYYFVVRAYNQYGESGDSNEVSWNSSSADVNAPSVTISSPSSGDTHITGANSLTLAGTAADNVSVTSVSWTNNRGGSGTASGTTDWKISNITLHCGTHNVITVTAQDNAGNTGTDTITVDVKPCPVPLTVGE